VIHIAFWFHDHDPYPIHPEIQEIEQWAQLVHGLDGKIMDSDSNWPTIPCNNASVLEDNPVLIDVTITFQYPP